MPISGLGPHGETAQSPDRLRISAEEAERARQGKFRVAVVLHTTKSDWAKQHLVGIAKTLGDHGAAIIEVVDCNFDVATQNASFERLIQSKPDAIISLPVGNNVMADTYRKASKAGIKLILLDNVPTGLLPGKDYVSLVSADNFGLGQIGAELLSPHVAQGGEVGILTYRKDFYATNEREIAFRRWTETKRPDIIVRQGEFDEPSHAGETLNRLLELHPTMSGIFAVWDEAAISAMETMRTNGTNLPMTTIDLGEDAAQALAQGTIMKGVGSQRPYDQGVAAARATLLSLIDRQPPPWLALPGLAVSRENIIESYQVIWHMPPPARLVKAVLG
ncbi:MAG: substrate-binding domain-containing protein [Alphaproteobacteria bacterium]|nr:substrate-binding domain-containing protein [Alphaproteobacteria bacterium]